MEYLLLMNQINSTAECLTKNIKIGSNNHHLLGPSTPQGPFLQLLKRKRENQETSSTINLPTSKLF